MCSWCWGFSNTIAALAAETGLPVQVVMGGLAPGPAARPLDRAMADTIAHHWHQVQKASGQPFDHAALEARVDTPWRYDTMVPCMAVIAARSQDPGCALPYLERLHHAFYARGIDITDPAQHLSLAADLVPDSAALVAALTDPALAHAARQEFAQAREMGVAGFPTVMARDGDTWALFTRGWTPKDPLMDRMLAWLHERDATPTQGESCDIDGDC